MAQYTCSYLENTEMTKKKYVERKTAFTVNTRALSCIRITLYSFIHVFVCRYFKLIVIKDTKYRLIRTHLVSVVIFAQPNARLQPNSR